MATGRRGASIGGKSEGAGGGSNVGGGARTGAERGYPEGNDTVVSRGPCSECGSGRRFVTYADGHAHCHACGHRTHPGEDAVTGGTPQSIGPGVGAIVTERDHGKRSQHLDLLRSQDAGDPFPTLGKRKLNSHTLKTYGYFVTEYKGASVHVAPYYDQQGNLAAQKLRYEGKRFVILGGTTGDCRMFGHQVYGDKFNKRVVITGGELDAMSVAQAMDFGCPAVSVTSGESAAAKSLKANWRWLDRFESIVLWLDDDEVGRAAMEECARLFAVGKVFIAKAPPGFKDASDVLQAGKPGDIKLAVYGATAWRPQGIVNAADSADDVCQPKEGDQHAWSYHWPWEFAEDCLGKMLPGQVCYHVAGTGIGKSTAMAEIAHSLVSQKCKVGLMFFEDTRRDVKLRLMSIAVNDRLDARPRSDEEMRALHQRVFGDRMIELFDPETAEWSVGAILDYVRYCAKALDCRVIFIDPLTFIAAGLSLGDDERRALDKASRDLAALAKELGIMLHIAHHLTDPRDGGGHTEGAASHLNQVRGSGGIANFATFVIGHERNQQAEGDGFLLTQLRSLKNRPRSITGPMGVLRYDMQSGRLKPTKDKYPEVETARGARRRPSPISAATTSDDY